MRKTMIAALLALLASGCMIGPDYLRPQVETPPAWRLSEQTANDLANTAWWKQFDDPVLDDLVSTALHNNHDLLIATARIEEFAGRYGIVSCRTLPASRRRLRGEPAAQHTFRRQQSPPPTTATRR
jgi:multidrug efflux system outer membrane protein